MDDINEAKNDYKLQISAATSSKEWENFNVHKAFNRTLTFAYMYKYEVWTHNSDTSKKQTMAWNHQFTEHLTYDKKNEAFVV